MSKPANRKRKNKPDKRGARSPGPGKVRESERKRQSRGENPRQPLEIIFCPINGCVDEAVNSIAMIRDGKRSVEHRCRTHTDKHHHLLIGPGPL